jgi:hypothetical protein
MSTADQFFVASTSSFPLTSQRGENLSMSAKSVRPVKLGLERLLEDAASIVKGCARWIDLQSGIGQSSLSTCR